MFPFVKDAESAAFLREIASLMSAFGGGGEKGVNAMMGAYWKDVDDIRDEELMNETPYYWAMSILHHPTIGDNQPEWYLDKKFMPPPEWIREKYYDHKL